MQWPIRISIKANQMKHYGKSTAIILFAIFFVAVAGNLSAQNKPNPDAGKHLFILSGQSNMAGLKPEESFRPTVEAAFGKENVIVVKDAQGGQPIRRWHKKWKMREGENPKFIGDLYVKLMTKVNKAIKDQKIKTVTFLWMQGEKDAREKNAEVYAASLQGLLDQLSGDFKRTDINFVIGRLSDFDMDNKRYPHWTKLREIQVKFADASRRREWVNTDDLNDGLNRRGKPIKNDLHYSENGYRVFGQRLANKAIFLITGKKPPDKKDGEGLAPEKNGLSQLTAAGTPLGKADKIAFFGDSVTMQGGYIQLMQKSLKQSANTRQLQVKLFKHGLNGGRVPTVLAGKSPWGDLGGTMQSLLKKEKPTIVVIYLGINDVWHGKNGTTKTEFEIGLKKMVAMCKAINATTILCTPSVIGEETKNNDLNRTLGEYAEIIRKLADDQSLVLCDLHDAFLKKLKKVNADNQHQGNLTYDGVHMNQQGNALIADQISRAIIEACKIRSSTQ
jgi:lysophospholipase L1-like esterase